METAQNNSFKTFAWVIAVMFIASMIAIVIIKTSESNGPKQKIDDVISIHKMPDGITCYSYMSRGANVGGLSCLKEGQ